MKNLRIAQKLMAMFAVVAALFAAVAGLSAYELHALDTVSSQIARNQLPQSFAADAINTALSDFYAALEAHVLATDPKYEQAATRKLRSLEILIDKKYSELMQRDNDAREMQMLTAFHGKWVKYLELAHNAESLSHQSRDHDAASLLQSGQGLFDSLSDDLDGYSDYQVTEAASQAKQADDTYASALITAAVSLVVALGVLGFILTALVRMIAQPLARMTDAMALMAAGNRDVAVPIEARADEVGGLAKALAGFRDQLALADQAKEEQAQLLVASIGAALGKLAEGDLTARVSVELAGPFAQLKGDFNEAISRLEETVQQVAGSAGGIATGASEIRAASDDLALRTEHQASSLERTATSMREVTAMVQETAAGAAEVLSSIGEAHDSADEGRQVVDAQWRQWTRSKVHRAKSATSSMSSMVSPSRPTCWH